MDANHLGSRKTKSVVMQRKFHIPRTVVERFTGLCRSCPEKGRPVPASGTLRPIRTDAFLDRIQIDLINLAATPDGSYKYILTVRDHFTRCTWLYALQTKEAQGVADNLEKQFDLFGAPSILQSDNGKEFVAHVIKALAATVNATLINGRPYHPQSQGSVERANGVVSDLLYKWMRDKARTDWHNGLSSC
eukprot:Opistho-2@62365